MILLKIFTNNLNSIVFLFSTRLGLTNRVGMVKIIFLTISYLYICKLYGFSRHLYFCKMFGLSWFLIVDV